MLYDTVILVLPWPDRMLPPTGTVQLIELALLGMDATVYVNVRFGHKPVCITSMGPALPGFNLVTCNVRGRLLPQPFEAITLTEPDVNPAGYVKRILLLPCPVKPVEPAGTVQVYVLTALCCGTV